MNGDLGVLEKIRTALVEGHVEQTKELVRQALDLGHSATDILTQALAIGIMDAKKRYELTHDGFRVRKGISRTQVFTLKKIDSTIKAFDAGWTLIQGRLPASNRGKIVLGVLHNKQDHGKIIIGTILRAHGFDVHDLGNRLKPLQILAAAKEYNAELIALSIMTNQAISHLENLTNLLRNAELPINLLIGGVAAGPFLAEKTGAYYAQDLTDVVQVATLALEKTRSGQFRYLESRSSDRLTERFNSKDVGSIDPDLQNFLIQYNMRGKIIAIDELCFNADVEKACRECTTRRTGSCPPLDPGQKFSSHTIMSPAQFARHLKDYGCALLVEWPLDHEDLNSEEFYRFITDRALELESLGRKIAAHSLVLKFGSPCPYCSRCELVEKGACRIPNKLRLNPEAVHLDVIATARNVRIPCTGASFYAILLLGD